MHFALILGSCITLSVKREGKSVKLDLISRTEAINLELAKSLLDVLQTDWSPAKFDDKILSFPANVNQPDYNATYEY